MTVKQINENKLVTAKSSLSYATSRLHQLSIYSMDDLMDMQHYITAAYKALNQIARSSDVLRRSQYDTSIQEELPL